LSIRTNILDWLDANGYAANIAVLFEEGTGTPAEHFTTTPVTLKGSPGWTVDGTYGNAGRASAGGDGWRILGAIGLLNTTAQTMIIARRSADTTPRDSIIAGAVVGGTTTRCHAHCPWGDGNVYFDFGGATAPNRLTHAHTKTTNLEIWAFRAGASGSSIWLNGTQVASQGTAITRGVDTGNVDIKDQDSFDCYFAIFVPDEVPDAILAQFTESILSIGPVDFVGSPPDEDSIGLVDGAARMRAVDVDFAEADEESIGIVDATPTARVFDLVEAQGPEESIGFVDGPPDNIQSLGYQLAAGPEESIGLTDAESETGDPPSADTQSLFGDRPLLLVTSYLDTGPERLSDMPVQHPSWDYRPEILKWGTIKTEIPIPPGPPIVDQAEIEFADAPDEDGVQHARQILDERTQIRRKIEFKIGFDGGKEHLFPIPFIGEHIPPAIFPPDRVRLKARAFWNRLLNRPIPIIGTRRNFPNLPEGVDEFDFPIVFGPHVSPVDNPQGVFRLQLCDTETNDYAANQTISNAITAVYRRLAGESLATLVDPSEYLHLTSLRTIGPVTYAFTFVRMLATQAEGTEIFADIDGMGSSGPIFSIPAIPYPTSITNPVLHAYNLMYYLSLLEPELQWDGPSVVAAYEFFETLALPFAGSVTKRGLTFGNVLTWIMSTAQFWVFPNDHGKLEIQVFDEPPSDRILLDETYDILGMQSIKGSRSRVDITPMQPETIATRCNARYGINNATGQYADTAVYDNEEDQIELAQAGNDPEAGIIPIDVDLPWARIEETALWAAAKILEFKGLRAYRVELYLDLPRNVDRIRLARWFGLNYYGGLGGPWVNQPFFTYRRNLELYGLRMQVSALTKHICATPEQAVVSIGSWARNSRVGPFWFACKIFACMRDTRTSDNKLFVLMHGDGHVFEPTDNDVFPDLENPIASFDAHRAGNIIHVATQELTTGRVAYHQFDMALQRWTLLNEEVLASNSHGDIAVSMCVLQPSGQPLIWYQGDRGLGTGWIYFTGPGYYKRAKLKWRIAEGIWSTEIDTGDPDIAAAGATPYEGKVSVNLSRAIPDNADRAILIHSRGEPLDIASTEDFEIQVLRANKTLSTTVEFQGTGLQGYSPASICGDYDGFEDENGDYWIFAPILWGGEPQIFIWKSGDNLGVADFSIYPIMGFVTQDALNSAQPAIGVKYLRGLLHMLVAKNSGFANYKTIEPPLMEVSPNDSEGLQAGPTWGSDGLQMLGMAAITLGGRVLLLSLQNGGGAGFLFDVRRVDELPVAADYTLSDFITDFS